MNDPKLPNLATALDAGAMAGVLARECLAPGRFEVRECRIGHVRYRPGRNCLIGYELTVRDLQGGGEFRHLLCGRVGEPATSAQRWQKAMAQPLTPVAAGAPVTHIPEMGMVVWAFPNERKLQGLQRLLNPNELLASLLPDLAIVSARSELVHYVPEHGCVVRVNLQLAAGARVLYAKAYADDAGERTHRWMLDLWNARHPELVTARPVAYADRVLWQEEVAGEKASVDGPLDVCAQALARLHQTPLNGLPAADFDPRERLDRTRRQAIDAGLDTDRLDAIINELLERLPDLETPAEATLHGDLHLKNFILRDGAAALIDLDTLRRGDPLVDLGSFAANLLYRGAPQAAVDSFVREYARSAPWPVPESALAWHMVYSLVAERAFRSISRRKTDTGPVLDMAEALLERSAAGATMSRFRRMVREMEGEPLDVFYKTYWKVRSLGKSEVTVSYRTQGGVIAVRNMGPAPAEWRFPQDPAMPWLGQALSRGADEVLNYRPLNRCTARYTLPDAGTAYGKTYSDDRGAAVDQRLRALWKLSGEGGARFPMGRPLGYDAEVHTVWQQEFPGRPILDLAGTAGFDTALAGAAARLAFLHDSALECPARMSLNEQLSELDKKMRKLAFVLPSLEPRLRRITGLLGARLAGLTPVHALVVHGDFHLRQLMVNGSSTALFDFDEIGIGDAVEDFGHFLADLESYGFEAARTAHIRALILGAYEEACGRAVPADRLAWHAATQLLTRAYRGLLQLRADMEPRAARLIALAEAEL